MEYLKDDDIVKINNKNIIFLYLLKHGGKNLSYFKYMQIVKFKIVI